MAVCVAPKCLAMSCLVSFGSTARMVAAPAIRAPWMTDRPTPPAPITATLEPGLTLAVLIAAPTPGGMPQPSSAAYSNGTSCAILTTAWNGTTISSAQVPTPAMPNAGVPSPSRKRGSPKAWPMKAMQRYGSPRRHSGQMPQSGDQLTTTWSPTATLVTWAPISAITPEPSCPMTAGGMVGRTPVRVDRSE